MGVLAIWRYPVKAMLGQQLESVEVGAGGLAGDRRWVVADAVTGARIANKRGPTSPLLRACRAELIDDELVVTLPSGRVVRGVGAIGAALSELLERPVVLIEHDAEGRGYLHTSGYHDAAPVHLLTTQSLDRMRAVDPAIDWDPRRFRANLLLSGPADDAALVGAQLSGDGLALAPGLPTPRCVVPTRASEELPHAPKLLKRLAGPNRWNLGPIGRPVCLGLYAEVPAAGRLSVGTTLAVTPRAPGTSAQDALDVTLSKLFSPPSA